MTVNVNKRGREVKVEGSLLEIIFHAMSSDTTLSIVIIKWNVTLK